MQHTKFLAVARLAICALGTIVLVAGASAALAQTGTSPADKSAAKRSMDVQHSMKPGMADSEGMHKSMMGMMKGMESMKMTGDADRDFAMMMKMHHQGALDMAQVELKSGNDAKMRAMAKRVIEAQQKEIKEFDQWTAKHK